MANANINVFELTSTELHKLNAFDGVSTSTKSKFKESLKRKAAKSKLRKEGISRFKKPAKIAYNKLKVEGLMFWEDATADDIAAMDYTPEDEVVLVVDPDMENSPETEEEASEAAEALIGDTVCKCPVCGVNYVATEVNTEEETACPVCGESGTQLVVGTICEPVDDEPVDDEPVDDEPVDDEPVDDEPVDDEFTDDKPVDDEFTDDESTDDEFGESVRRARQRTRMRRESAKRAVESTHKFARSAVKSTLNKRAVVGSRTRMEGVKSASYNFDESVLNKMLTKFSKENYSNVSRVVIQKARVAGKSLTLEGVVTTIKGSRKPITLRCESFVPTNTSTIVMKLKEVGKSRVFATEATSKTAPFTVTCTVRNKTITPTRMSYNYNVTEGKNRYNVSGRVNLNEGVNNSNARSSIGRTRGLSNRPITKKFGK